MHSGSSTRSREDTRRRSRCKEAVFSSIQFELEGRHMLDLFAGSGQMGLKRCRAECTHCTLTDSSRAEGGINTSNAKKTKLNESCTIKCATEQLSFVRSRRKIRPCGILPSYAGETLPRYKGVVTYDVCDGAVILWRDETYGVGTSPCWRVTPCASRRDTAER